MSNFYLVGTLAALFLGVSHAIYLYGLVLNGAGTSPAESRVPAIIFTVWTCILWVLLGAYLVVLWLVAVVFYLFFKVFRKP